MIQNMISVTTGLTASAITFWSLKAAMGFTIREFLSALGKLLFGENAPPPTPESESDPEDQRHRHLMGTQLAYSDALHLLHSFMERHALPPTVTERHPHRTRTLQEATFVIREEASVIFNHKICLN